MAESCVYGEQRITQSQNLNYNRQKKLSGMRFQTIYFEQYCVTEIFRHEYLIVSRQRKIFARVNVTIYIREKSGFFHT